MINCTVNWSEMSRVVGPCIRPGGPLLTERALEVCSLPAGSRIADIGCGAGGTLQHLERAGAYRLVGLDYSKTLLGEAVPRLGPGRLVQGRAEILPFRSDFFDALFCECVLSILDDRRKALREFARVVKAGGFLIVSDLFRRGYPSQGVPEGKTGHLLTRKLIARDHIVGLLKRLGFSLLLWEEHDRLLRELAVRMILAGESLPDPWGCMKEKKSDHAEISYFLLVARKGEDGCQ